MNVIARLEYELAYYDHAVHRFNHYTTRTPPKRNFNLTITESLPLLDELLPTGLKLPVRTHPVQSAGDVEYTNCLSANES